MKGLLTLIVAVGLTFSFSGVAGAAASFSPSTQHIYGSTATASWALTWSGGTGEWIVMFDPGDGTKMRTINSRTRYTTMPYKYEYNKNVAAVTYKPDLLVLDYNTFIGVGTATATVYKTWH